MFWLAFGTYTICVVIIWAFFVLTRIHAYKFKNFSNNVGWVTNLLFSILLTLTIVGYILVFTIDETNVTINTTDNKKTIIEYY